MFLPVPSTPCILYLFADPRTTNWPLMSTPWSTLGLISLYIATVTISPRVMKNREAFNLKWLLVVYNFVLVILSLYMLCEVRVVFIINTTMLGTSIGSYILRRSWQNYTLRILVSVYGNPPQKIQYFSFEIKAFKPFVISQPRHKLCH